MKRIVIFAAIAGGLALAAGLLMRTTRASPQPPRRESGVGTPEERMDGAVEGTFPASDPPAAMSSLVSGAPSRSP